mmetsp:Transcript_7589/g.16471  ORF Transcript_7589/g.16471 Transcript_7589/m.16471 type:complete len:244 (-) Transcript_7589:1800-2531(-)|eukprot:CAMPEP_0113309826 /NCGR_PEP_ID=MMETSP0010_2-20120614/7713_1 /TAXON_ID=216773 ORGANISM="Corethron hystrix, Strain 308" /NCGR_SAMPLE_ID=MMETSP0010_2 /ASSEMBLY_ACC=CAM_ASM_000155 /LENGTH=243 /DNA_ID=CAMNT_0000165153 /DNA_START=127 /DNA_END=858 /DNA_ORIENTATION=+ /assembly_acc=CAM_ASM_000155
MGDKERDMSEIHKTDDIESPGSLSLSEKQEGKTSDDGVTEQSSDCDVTKKFPNSFKNARSSRMLKIVAAIAVLVILVLGITLRAKSKVPVPESLQGSSDEIMVESAHGTCVKPVQNPLRWGADVEIADRISCFNRHYAENKRSWESTSFLTEQDGKNTTFYDSVTGLSLFTAPIGRSWEEFKEESLDHGWPSFRDAEVIKERIRVLEDGEVVSIDGTHLGHNLPDKQGNRYCINLVSVAGNPV